MLRNALPGLAVPGLTLFWPLGLNRGDRERPFYPSASDCFATNRKEKNG